MSSWLSLLNPVNHAAWLAEALLLTDPSPPMSADPDIKPISEPTAPQTPPSFGVLSLRDDRSTDAIIQFFLSDPSFRAAAATETAKIQERDAQDGVKLAEGIALSVRRKVLEANPPVEPVTRVAVQGKAADAVADEILAACGGADDASGRVIILTGLSGTGKGTTTAKLAARLPNSMTWSNGNLFRCLALLADADCNSKGIPLNADALSADNVAKWVRLISFGQRPGTSIYDLHVLADGLDFWVGDVVNTLLKQPAISRSLPLVASFTQGDVIAAAGSALELLRSRGFNVLVEGRAQTLDYIRSKYRFELVLDDPSTVGMRQVALRVMSLALATLDVAEDRTEEATGRALFAALKTLASESS